MPATRHATLLENGRNQAVRMPREVELSGDEAVMHREGERQIIEPVPRTTLLEWLETPEPLDEDFPEIDDPPPEPVDDVRAGAAASSPVSTACHSRTGSTATERARPYPEQHGLARSLALPTPSRYRLSTSAQST